MRKKRLVTPGEFQKTVEFYAHSRYLQREREFREQNPGQIQREAYRQRAGELMLADWVWAERQVRKERAVVPVHPARVRGAAYYIWLDRQRKGIPGTAEDDWLEAEEMLARVDISIVSQPARRVA